jgi:tetratricopeptide (TPR) repeat protein
MISKKNMGFIFNQSSSFDAPATSYFFKYYDLMLQSYGLRGIAARSRSIIGWVANEAGSKNDSTQLSHIIEFLKATGIKEKEEYIALAGVKYKQGIFTREKNKWISYADAALSYVKKFGTHDHFTGYEAASYLYYYTDDKESLKKATRLIEREIAVDASYDNILLRAKLFHKMGDENKAISYANRAIDIAGEKKEDNSDAKDLLKEIKESGKK